MPRLSLQYDFNKEKHIIIEFDVAKDADNQLVFENITMKPNHYNSFLLNLKSDLKLIFDKKQNEYLFWQDNSSFINGDFRQIIKRMITLAKEAGFPEYRSQIG